MMTIVDRPLQKEVETRFTTCFNVVGNKSGGMDRAVKQCFQKAGGAYARAIALEKLSKSGSLPLQVWHTFPVFPETTIAKINALVTTKGATA
jgi:hypothetical protein